MKKNAFLDLLNSSSGVALMVIIFIMMILSMLAVMLVSLQTTRYATSESALREAQAFYIGESGTARAQELIYDNAYGFKVPRSSPWGADPDDPSNTSKGYFTETITVGNVTGTFYCSAEEVTPGEIELTVSSEIN